MDCGDLIGGGTQVVLAANQGDATKPGYIIKRTENLAEGVREMTLFETELFRMLFHLGCLAGLQHKAEDVSSLCGVDRRDIERHLLDQVSVNVAKCARLANISQDNVIVLLADFMINIPACDNNNQFNLLIQTGRSQFEQAFVHQLRFSLKRIQDKVATFKALVKKDAEKSSLQVVE